MNVILTNTGLLAVPMSSTDGISPWATTLYPHQPVAVRQAAITTVTVGENPSFAVPRRLRRLRQWLARAVHQWHGRDAAQRLTVSVENIGPEDVAVALGAEVVTVGAGELLQAENVGTIRIDAVLEASPKSEP